jgi:Tol biopolymer transport system component
VVVVDHAGKRRNVSEFFETAQGLAWVPGGGEVWFTAAKSGSNRALYAVNLSGKQRLLARVPGTLTLYDVSSTGRVVVTRDTNRQELLARSAGDQKERDISWLDWSNASDISADGKTLLFSEAGEGGGAGYSVYVRGTDGSPAVRLGEGRAQALSPDAKWALVITHIASEPQIVLYPTGTGETRTLAREGLSAQAAQWLPDGKQLLMTANESGHGSRLFLWDLSGGKPRAISPEGYRSFSRTVSPDGKLVAARGPDQRLYLYPIAGGEPSAIPGLTADDTPTAWSVDGRFLYVDRRRELPARVYRLEVATGRKEIWKELMPFDAAGVTAISPPLVTPDGKSYAYGYIRMLSDLYLVEGLK